MGKKAKKEAKKRPQEIARRLPNISFTRKNYLLLILSVLVIIAGFISLAMGSVTLAPILLVIGYCVLVPLAILIR